MRVAEKWDESMPGDSDWRRERARRAEAEASLARTQAVAAMLHADAEKIRLERELDDVTEQHELAAHGAAAPR